MEFLFDRLKEKRIKLSLVLILFNLVYNLIKKKKIYEFDIKKI